MTEKIPVKNAMQSTMRFKDGSIEHFPSEWLLDLNKYVLLFKYIYI